MISRSY